MIRRILWLYISTILLHDPTAAVVELQLTETLFFNPTNGDSQIYAVDWRTNGDYELLAATGSNLTIAYWKKAKNVTINSSIPIYDWKLQNVMQSQQTSSELVARALAFSPDGSLAASGAF